MAEAKLDVQALVARMPEVDKPGTASKFTGPKPEEAEEVYRAILGGGRAALRELLGLVKDPADAGFVDYKAEYVLHGLVVYVGRRGEERGREMVAEALAEGLGDEKVSKATRGLWMRELQWVAGPAQAPVLGRWVGDEELGMYAIAALVAIGRGAVPELRKALGTVRGRNLLGVIQGLGRLEAVVALPELRRLMLHGDREVRIAACWAVANLGDGTVWQGLLKLAEGGDDWERVQVTKACFLLAERLAGAGKGREAMRIYEHLQRTRTGEKERYVREAAERALAALRVAA